MNQTIRRKAVCIAAAAMLCCTALPHKLPARAAEPAPTVQAAPDTEPVKVLISLKGGSLLDAVGKEALGSDAAKAAAEEIAAQQLRVQQQVRRLWPSLKTGAAYNVLLNGFCCTLPETLFDAVRALCDVADIERLPEILVPEMSNAAALSGLPQFTQQTGCTGAGQVIAVIDSELSTDHPMFAALPESVETKLTKEDIAALAENGALHKNPDPDRAYRSSKLPYAVDYADDELYDAVADPDCYHGTHVCGIAAGNAFVNSSGRTVSGMAPDAQLVFMAVGAVRSAIDSEAALLALEDAVVMQADVINMSWGSFLESYDGNLFARVLKAADEAGISVCTSAGNSDNGERSLRRSNYPESPDVSTIDDKTERDGRAFVVASADNSTSYKRGILRFEGEEIVYAPVYTPNGAASYLSDLLPMGDYGYVDAGTLTSAALSEPNPPDCSGKLMLVQQTALPVHAVAAAAQARNACGVLLADRSGGEQPFGAFCESISLPVAVITAETGSRLAAAAHKSVQIPGNLIEQESEQKVSFYTSWGTSHSLDLRPDIAGIGGSVESAAYGGSTAILSGTSMASPYVAGCTAVVRQYLREQGISAEGSALVQYVRNLMMNTAVPFSEDGLLVPPRRQGAGLVSLDRLMQCKAVLTGPEQDAKINLYDKIGDRFAFDVTLTNLSNETVTFADAQLQLTTDSAVFSEEKGCSVIKGQQALSCSADLSELTAIGAGESRNVTVRVSLDPEQTAAISAVFCNGFFIDGYLLLSGAQNSADISIPLCGYHGDWTQLPVYSDKVLLAMTHFGQCLGAAGLPLSEAFPLIQQVLARIPAEKLSAVEHDTMFYGLFLEYATPAELNRIENSAKELWISPNGDTLCDVLDSVSFEIRRQALARYSITDENGEILFSDETALLPPLNDPQFPDRDKPLVTLPVRADLTDCAEGQYSFCARLSIDYQGAQENPQILELPFRIDKTAPELFCDVEIRDNRKYLTLNARDNGAIDCAFLVANCADDSRKQDSFNALRLMSIYNVLREGNPFPYFYNENPEKPLPYVCQLLIPQNGIDEPVYSFADMVPLYPNFFGEYSMEYDVTGLTDVSVVVFDKAWNFAEYSAEGGTELTLKEGVWLDSGRGFMEIRGNSIRYADFFTGDVTAYDYTLKDRVLTMTAPGQTLTRQLYFKKTTEISYESEETDSPGTMKMWADPDITKLEDMPFHAIREIEPLLTAFYEKHTGYHVLSTEPRIDVAQQMEFAVTTEEPGEYGNVRYIEMDLTNGRGSCDELGDFMLFSQDVTEIEPGIYLSENMGFYLCFREDCSTGRQMIVQSYSVYDLYEFCDRDFAYTIGENGSIEMRFEGESYSGYVSVSEDGTLNLSLKRLGMFFLKRTGHTAEDTVNFRNSTQMMEIAAAYHEAVTGKPAELYSLSGFLDDRAVIWFEGETFYYVDPFTMQGTDENGKFVDLLDIPQMPENAIPLDRLAEMAIKDLADKTGITDAAASARLLPDGTVTVTLYSAEDYTAYGHYSVDALTGTGTDTGGGEVCLPQTGNNAPGEAAAAGLAVLLLLIGIAAFSFALRKRKA